MILWAWDWLANAIAYGVIGIAGIDWDYALFVAAALAYVARDEMRSKSADFATRELHERVAKMELLWTRAAEMDHIHELSRRITKIEDDNTEAEEALDEMVAAEVAAAAKKKPPARRKR